MKSSLRKMRGFTFRKHDHKEKRDARFQIYQDELLQASQDMLGMRNCYDSLLSAAAATVNSAYEFSEALKELGDCLLEQTASLDDEESGRVLLMLGKAQFELQKLVDSYRVHIIQTITTPSESLIKELQTVEEMKRQCDEKRELCEFMIAAQKEIGKSGNAKADSVTREQLQATKEDYQDEADLFVFRLKSLKQGQSRSLLTQAARHHAAQLNFFRKGVKSLEAVEPHVKVVAEQQHIDYQFIGLGDDDTEQEVDDHDGNDDGEVSFGYGENDQGQDVVSLSRNSLEENVDRLKTEYHHFNSGIRAVSLSAPLFPDKKVEYSERLRQMQPASTNKHHSYVLPTPVDSKNTSLKGSHNAVQASRVFNEGFATQLWHSSPLQPNMLGKDSKDLQLPNPTNLPKAYSSTLKENINSGPIRIPTPPHEELSMSQYSLNASDAKKIKRQAFSGPLTSQAPSDNSMLSASIYTAIQARVLAPKPGLAQKSPPRIASPRISELHELPRPPVGTAKPSKPSGLVGYSGPLMHRGHGLTTTNKSPISSSYTASPLPTPPGAMARSFSIPSSCQRTSIISVSELLETRTSQSISTEISSPPLTPISLTIGQPASAAPKSVDQDAEPKGPS